MSCKSALPAMIGNIRIVFDRFFVWRAVNCSPEGYPTFASEGIRLTMQWSRSDMVRSDAEDHGAERDESVRYLCE